MKKLMFAAMLALISACSCGQRDAQLEYLRASYCESVRYEDEIYCEYAPINPNVTIHYLPETDECRFFYADTGEEEIKNCFEEDLR
jgi:hypothetical protein